MRQLYFTVLFKDGTPINVHANNMDQATILAQAQKIQQGQPYDWKGVHGADEYTKDALRAEHNRKLQKAKDDLVLEWI